MEGHLVGRENNSIQALEAVRPKGTMYEINSVRCLLFKSNGGYV